MIPAPTHASLSTSAVSTDRQREHSRARRPTYSPGDRRHPISRWYLLPLANLAAAALSPTRVRPWQVTFAGFLFASVAAMLVLIGWFISAALLVLAAWFCDRLDGKLARRQGTASQLGAWLDANLDELVDVGLHAAVAQAASAITGSAWPWGLFAAFLLGKYLLLYGIHTDGSSIEATSSDEGSTAPSTGHLRRLYHLPGNADVRVHILVVLLATGWLTTELVLIAGYYNIRWLARYPLLISRLRESQTTSDH